jgi:hypothetical protein
METQFEQRWSRVRRDLCYYYGDGITCYFSLVLLVRGRAFVLNGNELLGDGLTEGSHDVVNPLDRLSCNDMRNALRYLEQRIYIQCRRNFLIERVQLSNVVDEMLLLVIFNEIPSCNPDKSV